MPPPRNENPRRTNGFNTPYTPGQLSTWVALPVLIVEFIVVVAPVLPLEAMIPCTIVFGLTAILAAYYAYWTQAIDPMDEHLAKHLERQANANDNDGNGNNDNNNGTGDNGFGGSLGGVGDEVDELKHCWICETQVSEHAMHCKFCNKCVGKFDHHCMWLNTCVGKANYEYFLLTMVYITAMLIVHASVQIGLMIDIFIDGPSKQRAEEWFKLDSSGVVVGIFIGFVVFDAIALSLILQLLYFHMQLRREGLTTYKFIVRETQRKRAKLNSEQAQKNQRTVAMGKAHDEGNGCLLIRLRYGEMCPCCDPLPPLEEKTDDEEVPAQPQPPRVESYNDDDDDDEENEEPAANVEHGSSDINFIKVSNGAS